MNVPDKPKVTKRRNKVLNFRSMPLESPCSWSYKRQLLPSLLSGSLSKKLIGAVTPRLVKFLLLLLLIHVVQYKDILELPHRIYFI